MSLELFGNVNMRGDAYNKNWVFANSKLVTKQMIGCKLSLKKVKTN